MSRNIALNRELHQYIITHSSPMDPLMTELIAETRHALADRAGMQIRPEQASFLTFLVKLVGVKNAVEVGTFTGMSSLSIARGMPDSGKLVCFDISDEYTLIARRFWERDGQKAKIELRLGDAREQLRALPHDPYLDFVFIDADKLGYPTYWEELVPRVRPGGVIVVDNVLWGGTILDADSDDETIKTIRAFNGIVASDERVEMLMLPVSDGMTLARKI